MTNLINPTIIGPTINWQALSETVTHFKAQGYEYVEAPWAVPRPILEVTFPQAQSVLGPSNEDLVGSAEQSFLYLIEEGQLAPGRYCALTPCFRVEPSYSETHRPYFMKVELFDALTPTTEQLTTTIEDCHAWFKKLAGDSGAFEIVETEIGFDINLNGIEIGSYGLREHGDLRWLYATGLAEPRFSVACGT